MSRKLSESIRIDQAFAPADVATPKTGTFYSMVDYRQAIGVVTTDTIAIGKKVTVQLVQAKDAAGTGVKDLTEVVTKTAVAAGKLTAQVGVNAGKLDSKNGFKFVAVKVTSDTSSAVNGAAVLVRGDARYGVGRA